MIVVIQQIYTANDFVIQQIDTANDCSNTTNLHS